MPEIMLISYLACALWSAPDEDLDSNFSIDDFFFRSIVNCVDYSGFNDDGMLSSKNSSKIRKSSG